MTRFVALIRDALRSETHDEPAVHFHAVGGRPEVCHDAGCSRPQMTVHQLRPRTAPRYALTP